MKFEKQVHAMAGAYSAIFTPFDDSNRVNLAMLAAIVEYQIANGIKGFFVTGSTGEGLLLDFDERLEVIKQVVEASQNRATVIAHVGHPSTDFAVRMAKGAAAVGADWISSVGPIYHGTTFEGGLRHYTAISNATDLPFMIYSLGGTVEPQRDKVFFELPNVCGMKYTGANFYSVQQMARFVDRPIALMSGFDEQFVAGQSFGFSGGIGTTFNFAPSFYSRIYEKYHAGDIKGAAELQSKINQVTHEMVQYENWSYRKAIMKYLGLDCGAARPPYEKLTEQQYESYAARLNELAVLNRNDGAEFCP